MEIILVSDGVHSVLKQNNLLDNNRHLKQVFVKGFKPFAASIKLYGKYKKRKVGFMRYVYELSGIGYSIRHQEGHGAVAIKKFNHLVNDLKKLDQKRKITKKPKHLVFSIEM